MKYLRFLTSWLVLAMASTPTSAQGTMCLGPDEVSTEHIRRIVSWTAATDSLAQATRTAFHLPAVPADSVSLVTDSTTCASLAQANRQLHPTSTAGLAVPVYVIRVGPTRFVVFDRMTMAGSWRIFDVYDATLAFVGGFVQ